MGSVNSGFTYSAAREWLTSRLDLERRPGAQPYSAEHYDLGGFAARLERLGAPQQRFRSIHIAGTKGKGSTAAMIESALRAAGRRTGLYTSPHLSDYPERIQVGGAAIAPELFAEALYDIIQRMGPGDGAKIEPANAPKDEPPPYRTVFEALTALAFEVFAREGIEWAVIETGLGGRLDCTNVVLPEVSVLTALGMDHTALLGDSLAKIAFEKGGIIKPGVPAIAARQSEAARREGLPVWEALAAERGCPFLRAEEFIDIDLISESKEGQRVQIRAIRRATRDSAWKSASRGRFPGAPSRRGWDWWASISARIFGRPRRSGRFFARAGWTDQASRAGRGRRAAFHGRLSRRASRPAAGPDAFRYSPPNRASFWMGRIVRFPFRRL